jgi:hypothetical protein
LRQLGSAAPKAEHPYTTQVAAEWTLSDTAVERIEPIREGRGLTIYPDFQCALISLGIAMPGWQRPSGRSGSRGRVADHDPGRRPPVGQGRPGAAASRRCCLLVVARDLGRRHENTYVTILELGHLNL